MTSMSSTPSHDNYTMHMRETRCETAATCLDLSNPSPAAEAGQCLAKCDPKWIDGHTKLEYTHPAGNRVVFDISDPHQRYWTESALRTSMINYQTSRRRWTQKSAWLLKRQQEVAKSERKMQHRKQMAINTFVRLKLLDTFRPADRKTPQSSIPSTTNALASIDIDTSISRPSLSATCTMRTIQTESAASSASASASTR